MKKFVTWLLVCLMVVSALPMAVFAESAEAVCPGKGQPHSASNCTSTLLTEVKATCEKSGYVLNACTTCATPFVVSTSEALECVEDTIEAVDGTCGTKEIVGKNYCTTCTVEGCTDCVNVTTAPAVTQKDVRDDHRGNWELISTYDDCTKGQTYYCPVCEETFSVRGADYADHKWELVAVTVEPTCTDKGRALLACVAKNCNAEKTVEVAALGHAMDYDTPAIEGTPATCTETGIKDIYGCSRCDRQLVIVGNKYVAMTDENKIIPMAHDFGEGAVSATNPEGWKLVRNYVAGDCTTDESIEAYCQFCNKYISEVLTEAPGHTKNAGTDGSVACVGTYKEYTCTASGCGYTWKEWNTADKAKPTTKTHKFGTYAAASATGSGVDISFNAFNCVTDKVATWDCACGETMTETVATAPGHIVATQTVQSTNCMIPTYTFEYCNSGVDCGMHTYTDDVAKVIDGKLTFVGTWTDGTSTYTTAETPNYTTTHPQLVVQVGENVEFIRIVSVSVDDNGDFIFADNHNWTKTYNTADVIPGVTVAGLGQATCTAEGHYVNICVKHAIMEKDAGGNPLIGTDSVKPHNWTDAGLVPGSAKAATCTVDGTKATYECACGALAIKEGTTFVAKTDANVVIPKTNHNMVNLVVKSDALCNTVAAKWDATNGWVATTGYDYTIQVCTNAHCNETASTISGLKAVVAGIPASSDTLKYVDTAYATVTLGDKACGNIAVYGSILKAAAEHAVPATAAGWTKMNDNVILCEAPLIYTVACPCGVNVMVEDASQVGKHVNDSDYTDAGEVAPESVNCGGDINTVPKYGKFACQFCGELFDNDPATATVKVNHNTITIAQADTQFVSCDKDVWSKVGTLCLDCDKWDGEGDAAVKTYEGGDHDIVHHDAVPAQCGIDGVKAYDTCSRCDYTNVPEADRKIEALRHIPVRVNDLSAEKALDCTITGGTYFRCGLCNGKLAGGHKVVVEAADLAKAHDFTDPQTEGATCTTDGKTYNKCANCAVIDETSVEILPATGHTDATGKFFSDCDTGYTGGRTCTVCGPVAVTHGDNLVEHSVDATCTEPGVEYTYCTYCEIYVYGPVVYEAPGEHAWVDVLAGKEADEDGWFVTVEPTATENGSKIRQCRYCGHTETGVVYAPVQYSVVVDNYIVPGATIVENSIVAVTVVLNKTIASVWGFELDVNVPDDNNFEYLGVEDVNANFTIQVADHGEKISMFAYNITGVENIAVESDVELVTLLFRVVAPRTTTGAKALDYENAYEFSIDEDTILTLDADGEHIGNIVSDPAKVEIGKLLCMDDEDALTINDLRVAFLLIQDGKYASEFDIDLDGALTLSDISTIQALILVADAQFDAEVAKLLKAAW